MPENSSPPSLLPYPLHLGVEFLPWSPAQGRDGSLGESPSRGPHKRVPHHMAGHPGEFDTKRSIRDAGADEHSRQLVDYALPRAGRETATVGFAFRKPLTAVIRTSGFVERAAMDHERICHSANPFSKARRRGKAISRLNSRKLLRSQALKGDRLRSRSRGARQRVTFPSAGISPGQRGSDLVLDLVLRRIQRVQAGGRVWRGWHLPIGSRQTVLGEHCAR